MSSSTAPGSAQPKGKSSDRRHNTRKCQPHDLVVETGIANVSSTPIVPPVSPSISSISEDVCWICAEPVKFYSVSGCNHRTCHFCALRLRVLYQKRDCTYCKTPQHQVVFTLSSSRPFEDYIGEAGPFSDDKLGIVFETKEIMDESLFILRFNCPQSECEFSGTGWPDLKLHVRDTHGQFLCDLCVRHKKIFSHEHLLYTPRMLVQHLPSLRRPPLLPSQHGTQADGGGNSHGVNVEVIHPLCSFCRECFYSDDELFGHLRERHEECFLCRRLGNRDHYFQNYEKLEQHFQSDHFPCTHPDCLDQKFVVFSSQMDLQAHQIHQHGEAMSARQRKDKMRIDGVFGSSDPRLNSRNRIDGHVNLSPDLSELNGRASRGLSRDRFTDNSRLLYEDSTSTESISMNLRSLKDYIRNLSSHAQLSILSNVQSFRASESSSRDMLDNVFSIFDRNIGLMAPVVAEIVDIFECNKEKQSDLLQSWNRLKIDEREQFPSLAPHSTGGAGSANMAGGHAERLKTVSGRANRLRQPSSRVWDRVERAAASNLSPLPTIVRAHGHSPRHPVTSHHLSETFPSLAASSSAKGNMRWTGTVPDKTIQPGTASNSSMNSINAFPSLPSSSRAQVPNELIRGNRSPPNDPPAKSAWKAERGRETAVLHPALTVEEPSTNKRRNKKGKERLFTLGSLPTA